MGHGVDGDGTVSNPVEDTEQTTTEGGGSIPTSFYQSPEVITLAPSWATNPDTGQPYTANDVNILLMPSYNSYTTDLPASIFTTYPPNSTFLYRGDLTHTIYTNLPDTTYDLNGSTFMEERINGRNFSWLMPFNHFMDNKTYTFRNGVLGDGTAILFNFNSSGDNTLVFEESLTLSHADVNISRTSATFMGDTELDGIFVPGWGNTTYPHINVYKNFHATYFGRNNDGLGTATLNCIGDNSSITIDQKDPDTKVIIQVRLGTNPERITLGPGIQVVT